MKATVPLLLTIIIAAATTRAFAAAVHDPSMVACPSLARVLALAGTPDALQPMLTGAMTQPHQLTCHAYLECGTERDGHLRPAFKHCPPGELFDTKTSECTRPEMATCAPVLDVIKLSTEPERNAKCKDSNTTQLVPHETECQKFYICRDGAADLYECPEGLHFDVELQVCDWPTHANCDSGCDINPDPSCPSQVLQAHQRDCGKFYQCVHSEAVLMFCPQGLVFSPKLQVCDWPWSTECRLCGGMKH